MVEQDHRGVKWVTQPMLGFKTFAAVQSTLTGIELMHMLRKGQLEGGSEVGLSAADQFYVLASESFHRSRQLLSHRLHTKICDKAIELVASVRLCRNALWRTLYKQRSDCGPYSGQVESLMVASDVCIAACMP